MSGWKQPRGEMVRPWWNLQMTPSKKGQKICTIAPMRPKTSQPVCATETSKFCRQYMELCSNGKKRLINGWKWLEAKTSKKPCAIAHGRSKTGRQVPTMKMSKFCRDYYRFYKQMKEMTHYRMKIVCALAYQGQKTRALAYQGPKTAR